MSEATELIGPLLTFLSLELAAAGYLVNEVAENPTESCSVGMFSILYGFSIISALAYVITVAWPGGIGYELDWLLVAAGVLALLSIFAYGAGLYLLRDQYGS